MNLKLIFYKILTAEMFILVSSKLAHCVNNCFPKISMEYRYRHGIDTYRIPNASNMTTNPCIDKCKQPYSKKITSHYHIPRRGYPVRGHGNQVIMRELLLGHSISSKALNLFRNKSRITRHKDSSAFPINHQDHNIPQFRNESNETIGNFSKTEDLIPVNVSEIHKGSSNATMFPTVSKEHTVEYSTNSSSEIKKEKFPSILVTHPSKPDYSPKDADITNEDFEKYLKNTIGTDFGGIITDLLDIHKNETKL